ncbi:hypothetical protein QRD02_06540 [Aequorivita sp. SDUM287046]|uniref:Lipoprotein n=1 Tax=Aequorivita aurantiaca TaxID=3053356 RepID=A0ABT8DH43_9FLAO|nr:hypothetical protein [Aequorivita aurantiaca]MDN3724034.1 hypothetical protein [Aequorivita aurantiaca]
MKKLIIFSFCLFALILTGCSKDDDSSNEETEQQGDHTFTFTVSGPDINGITYNAVVPNAETFCSYTLIPNTPYAAAFFTISEGDETLSGYFLRQNNTLLPLGENIGSEPENSHLQIILKNQGQLYSLESLSGTCVSERFEIGSGGAYASIKVSFSGVFIGGPVGTNDMVEYQVEGEVDFKFIND